MTIDKAIELLRMHLVRRDSVAIVDLHEAERIGIEAMKRIQAGRVAGHILWEDKLPGET